MMARRKRPTKRLTASDKGSQPAASREQDLPWGSDQIATSNLSLHELFQQQARDMLDRADLDEEQKQSILIAMSCPCCGAGGLSFAAKLKRRT